MAKQVLTMLDRCLEDGKLSGSRELCGEFLGALEDADGERDGRDRGAYRFLKAVTVLLRLKGYNARDQMMPINEIELTGHPLLAFTTPTRAAGAPPGKPEPTVRALELAVHLARSSSIVSTIRLGFCELSPDGGDKCMTEVVRLVRQVGIGSQARFLDEVDLHGNSMDAEAVRKIVEAAVKERCERPRACAGSPPLWLDLSGNRVRNPGTVFQNLQAWAAWAHDKEKALCLADQDGCCRQSCPSNCMLHLPKFLEQAKPEARQQLQALTAPPEGSTSTAIVAVGASAGPPPLLPAPPILRPSPARKKPPEAWRPLASPATRRRDQACERSRGSKRKRSRGRRRQSPPRKRKEVQLRPGPGASSARARRKPSVSSTSEASASSSASSGADDTMLPQASPSPSRSVVCGPSGSEYSYTYSDGESAEEEPGPPSTEHLGLRVNRLIESLKSSAADGGEVPQSRRKRPVASADRVLPLRR